MDIWGVGILAFEFVNGTPPFESDSYEETKSRIRKLDYEFPDSASIYLRDFVQQCLKTDPKQRATLKQL